MTDTLAIDLPAISRGGIPIQSRRFLGHQAKVVFARHHQGLAIPAVYPPGWASWSWPAITLLRRRAVPAQLPALCVNGEVAR